MKTKTITRTLQVISFLMLSACSGYRLFDLAEIPDVTIGGELPLGEKTQANFDSIFQTVIEPKCLKCHIYGGKAEKVPLDTYEEIIKNLVLGNPEKSDLYLSVLPEARRRMPPSRSGIAPLDVDQIEALKVWITNGAPQKSATEPIDPIPVDPGVPQPTPVEPDPANPVEPQPNPEPSPIIPHFNDIYESIFKPKCMECHQTGGDAELVVLDIYEEITGIFGTVTPGKPEESALYKSVLPTTTRGKMPPPRSGIPALTEAEVAFVKTWIAAGAPK